MDCVEGISKSSYYDTLGVPIHSAPQDIRHAYRKLAMVISHYVFPLLIIFTSLLQIFCFVFVDANIPMFSLVDAEVASG